MTSKKARTKGLWCVTWSLLISAAAALGCAPEGSPTDTLAVQVWAQPDRVATRIMRPLDVKVGGTKVVWIADEFYGGVIRLDGEQELYGILGLADREPVQMVKPARLAAAPDLGLFVYDDSTRQVDLFTAFGLHIRAFEPGFRPAIMEIARSPLGLTFGYVESVADTARRLVVVRTDLDGGNPTTLVSRGTGPEVLRDLDITPFALAAARTESGLWLWARAETDTVYEVTARGVGRRLVLPAEDRQALGLLYDIEEKIVWTVLRREPEGGLRYRAYDAAGDGVLDAAHLLLGERETPVGFTAKAAQAGVVYGLRGDEMSGYQAEAYDLRIKAMRVEAARRSPTGWGN